MPAPRRLQAYRANLRAGRSGGVRLFSGPTLFLLTLVTFSPVNRGEAQTVKVDTTAGNELNSFSPLPALEAGLDRPRRGATDKLLVEPVLKESHSSGRGRSAIGRTPGCTLRRGIGIPRANAVARRAVGRHADQQRP